MATYRFDMAQAPIFVSAEDGGSQNAGLRKFLGFPNGWILSIFLGCGKDMEKLDIIGLYTKTWWFNGFSR